MQQIKRYKKRFLFECQCIYLESVGSGTLVFFDWDSATCITYSTDYYQRLTLESWFTNLEQTPLNRSQQLPAPYKQLIDEIKQN